MGLRLAVDALGSMVAHNTLGKHKSIIDKPFVPF
jgi:agmatinase